MEELRPSRVDQQHPVGGHDPGLLVQIVQQRRRHGKLLPVVHAVGQAVHDRKPIVLSTAGCPARLTLDLPVAVVQFGQAAHLGHAGHAGMG